MFANIGKLSVELKEKNTMSMFEGLEGSKHIKPKLKDVKHLQKTSKKLKCKGCECKFTDKEE